jgi:hypothetical protein
VDDKSQWKGRIRIGDDVDDLAADIAAAFGIDLP